MAERQAITVLGSTGSIGVNTLDVIARHPERYEVFALAALRSVDTLAAQCSAHRPRYAVWSIRRRRSNCARASRRMRAAARR
jgi:1-deoxy-D-xylulose-5-phosphate reductoisomerase